MSLITIFSAPKPFTNPHIATIQRNAIRSWLALGEEIEVILIGDDAGIAEAAQELGVRHLPKVACNPSGTPLVSSIFSLAREASSSPLLVYVNADILFLPEIITAARQLQRQAPDFLMVGQRWDLDVRETLEFSPGWAERLKQRVSQAGKLHTQGGSDYFVYPRTAFEQVPDFAIGRAGWDNWMLYETRRQGWPLVDGTAAVQIIHQNHDYSHLPGGQPHYRQPETFDNIRLAGGRIITRITLVDSNYWLEAGGKLRRAGLTWKKFWREVEIFPLIGLRSIPLGNLFYGIFHPRKAYPEFRGWLKTAAGSRK
jgi:hypothetical protein